MDISKTSPAQVKKEAIVWADHLNSIVGLMCFNLGLASVSTNNPAFYSIMSFLMIGLIHKVSFNKAKILRALQSKSNQSEHQKIILKDYFSYTSWKNTLPGLYGYCFLSLIVFSSVLGQNHPFLHHLFFGG